MRIWLLHNAVGFVPADEGGFRSGPDVISRDGEMTWTRESDDTSGFVRVRVHCRFAMGIFVAFVMRDVRGDLPGWSTG